jgi:hypothetical protein
MPGILRNENPLPSGCVSGFRIGNPNPSRRQSEQIGLFQQKQAVSPRGYVSRYKIGFFPSRHFFYPVPPFLLPRHKFGLGPSTFPEKGDFADIFLLYRSLAKELSIQGYREEWTRESSPMAVSGKSKSDLITIKNHLKWPIQTTASSPVN